MKPIILLIALLSFFGIQNPKAQEKSQTGMATWHVIRERLFNGENSYAYRWKENIRIQLKGANSSDSTIIVGLVKELNNLMEIIKVRIVKDNGNMILNLSPEPGTHYRTHTRGGWQNYTMTHLEIDLNTDSLTYIQKVNEIDYFVVRNLTKTFSPKEGETGYGGIFDSHDPVHARFTDIDKDLIRELYSKTFYRDFKKNFIQRYSYLYYLKLRFKNSLTQKSILFGILIALLTFFYIYYRGWFNQSSIIGYQFIKRGFIIVLAFSISDYFILQFVNNISPFSGIKTILLKLLLSVGTNSIIGFLAVAFMYLIEKRIIKNITHFNRNQVLIFFSTILSLFIATICLMIIPITFNRFIGSYKTVVVQMVLLSILIAFIRILFTYLNHRTQSFINQKDVEIARMKELKNQAELNALHSRINPHFLYNSLNSIAALAHTDPAKTENMAASLSELFRYSINKEDQTYVSVTEELDMVKKYLEVEKVRFGDRLDYEIDAAEKVIKNQVPKFLIQPLVENAIKHGVDKISGKGIIKIEIRQERKDMVIRIYDNGPGFPEEPVSGYGLQNLHDKLKILYGDDAILNWKNGENKHIQVTLKDQFQA